MKPNGVVLINSSLISIDSGRDDLDELKIPATDIAKQIGNVRAANIVALSAFVTRSKIVAFESLRTCVEQEFAKKPKVIPLNMEALDQGHKAATSS